jgi:glycosyltransferase involved in cell wall biosynthesis
MIPAYNPPTNYLEQTLRSVLGQDPGDSQMQIEVVDDCSPTVDVALLVREIAGERVEVSQTPKNLGLAGCWNTCIERSRGEWVHILHQDDYVLSEFYQTLAKTAERHPDISLLATRSFFVDNENTILGVSPRLCELENGSRRADDFFYITPIQCPGVAVKRSFYQAHGGFRSDLTFTLDCEMWSRVISNAGGLVTSAVLACYRTSDINESSRLRRSAKDLHDIERLNQLFTSRYPSFSARHAREQMCNIALGQALQFSLAGDLAASKAHSDFWRQNATAKLWFRRLTHKLERTLFK